MQNPRRHLALLVLAAVEAATLLSGAAAAATAGHAAPSAGRVRGTTAVAPVVVQVRPAAVARPAAPRPRPHHVSPRRHEPARPAVRPAPRRTSVVRVHRTSTTPEALMQQAIARIPGYRPGYATWTITSRYGHWGIADLGTGAIYIEPSVPSDLMYDVVVHEWSHVLSMHDYDMDVNTAVAEMNRVFGGSGLTGAERAADCMARLQGAHWTHYTPCDNTAWRQAAARLVAGQRL